MGKQPIAGIILAAGMSTRFGKAKQLHEVGSSTILSMVVDASIKSDLDFIVLVLGHESEKIKASLGDVLNESKITTVENELFQKGMSTSLQCGLKDVAKRALSIMVLMGDQPFLSHETINFIIKKFNSSEKDICVPVYKGRRGLPVCFTDKYYNDIMRIAGDIGAREIIQNNPSDICTVDIEDPTCFIDIDEKADLERIKFLLKERK